MVLGFLFFVLEASTAAGSQRFQVRNLADPFIQLIEMQPEQSASCVGGRKRQEL